MLWDMSWFMGGWLPTMLFKSKPIKIFKTIEEILPLLKEMEGVIVFSVSELRELQSSKLGKTNTEKELSEFKKMREIIDALSSIVAI